MNKSLVYDLYDLAHSRSPQKTCHNIAVALDGDDTSPLYKRIKRLGIATEGRVFEPITQATFVESLIGYISADPRGDRDKLLRNVSPSEATGDEVNKLLLRNMFLRNRDVDIARVVNNYFLAVRQRWPVAWDETSRGYILNRTNGFRALMRFFGWAYLRAAGTEPPTQQQFYNRIFENINLKDTDFTVENFPPGTSGEARLHKVFRGSEVL